MKTGGDIFSSTSSSSGSGSGSGSGLDSPEIWKKGQHLPNNFAALSSLRSDGTPKMRTIAIGVESHKKWQMEPFAYAYMNLVQKCLCKVVVICCLCKIQDEMGVDHPVDVENFSGISRRKLNEATSQLIKNLNHFLRNFRKQLSDKNVQLDIRVSAGPKNRDNLVKAAKALEPHWVVLDRSFGGQQKNIHAALECNLVLMKKGTNIEVLQLTPKYLGPVDIHDQISEEDPEAPATPNVGSRTPSSTVMPGTSISFTQELEVSSTRQETTTTISCFSCFCTRGTPIDTEGPTADHTVLYGDAGPGSKAVYLGKVGPHPTHPSIGEEFSVGPSSPAASPLYSRSVTKTTSKWSIKLLEAELEAQILRPPAEEDPPYLVQL